MFSGNQLTSTLANSEDQDEMLPNTTFLQDLQFVIVKKIFRLKIFLNYNLTPLDTYNGLS